MKRMKEPPAPNFFDQARWEKYGDFTYWVDAEKHKMERSESLADVKGPIFGKGVVYLSRDGLAEGLDVFILKKGPIIKRWGLADEDDLMASAVKIKSEWFLLQSGEDFEYEFDCDDKGEITEVEIGVVDADGIELERIAVHK